MTPKTEALAFRIWAVARRSGWNTDLAELSVELNTSIDSIRGTCQAKGWLPRLRNNTPQRGLVANNIHAADRFFLQLPMEGHHVH